MPKDKKRPNVSMMEEALTRLNPVHFPTMDNPNKTEERLDQMERDNKAAAEQREKEAAAKRRAGVKSRRDLGY